MNPHKLQKECAYISYFLFNVSAATRGLAEIKNHEEQGNNNDLLPLFLSKPSEIKRKTCCPFLLTAETQRNSMLEEIEREFEGSLENQIQ